MNNVILRFDSWCFDVKCVLAYFCYLTCCHFIVKLDSKYEIIIEECLLIKNILGLMRLLIKSSKYWVVILLTYCVVLFVVFQSNIDGCSWGFGWLWFICPGTCSFISSWNAKKSGLLLLCFYAHCFGFTIIYLTLWYHMWCCFQQKEAMEDSVEIVVEKLLHVTKDSNPKVSFCFCFNEVDLVIGF